MILKPLLQNFLALPCFRDTKNVMILKLWSSYQQYNSCFRDTKNVMILKPVGSTCSGKSGFRDTKNVMILKPNKVKVISLSKVLEILKMS